MLKIKNFNWIFRIFGFGFGCGFRVFRIFGFGFGNPNPHSKPGFFRVRTPLHITREKKCTLMYTYHALKKYLWNALQITLYFDKNKVVTRNVKILFTWIWHIHVNFFYFFLRENFRVFASQLCSSCFFNRIFYILTWL